MVYFCRTHCAGGLVHGLCAGRWWLVYLAWFRLCGGWSVRLYWIMPCRTISHFCRRACTHILRITPNSALLLPLPTYLTPPAPRSHATYTSTHFTLDARSGACYSITVSLFPAVLHLPSSRALCANGNAILFIPCLPSEACALKRTFTHMLRIGVPGRFCSRSCYH